MASASVTFRTYDSAIDYLNQLAYCDVHGEGWAVDRTLGQTVTHATDDDGVAFTITRTVTCQPAATQFDDEKWILTEDWN